MPGKPSLRAAILAVLALAVVGAILIWNWSLLEDIGSDLPGYAWLAFGLGVAATFAVGGGLMFLIFWSSRRGYDDAAASGSTSDDEKDLRP